MSLADFKPETLTVSFKGGSFDVRGLSIIDLSQLMRTHLNDLDALFDLYEKEANNISFGNVAMAKYATRLISDAPGLVSHIIALSADEPEMVNAAERLPMMAQLDAIQKIGKLTFEEVGGVKKLIEMISGLVTELQPERKPEAQVRSRSARGKK